jgi:putative transposase
MILSHKIQLNPNKKQEQYLQQCVGVSRFVYNWGLSEWKKQYKQELKVSGFNLCKQFNTIKKEQYPWVYNYPKDVNQHPFSNLQNAFNRFFKKQNSYPKFKKKGKHDSFYISNSVVKLKGKYIILSKTMKIKMFEELRFDGKIMSCTISRTADKWFASIAVDIGDYSKERISNNELGIDMGIKNYISCSNGDVIKPLKTLRDSLKKLKRLSRQHSKKQNDSNNKNKSKIKLSRFYYKISCIRKDYINKLTTKLCSENQTIIIENLNIKGLNKNRHLSFSFNDASFGEFVRQLEYKSKIFNSNIIKVGRFFASSKICSNCGCIKDDLKLSDRTYKCLECGFEIDRDFNASLNILNEGRVLMTNEEFKSVDKKALVTYNKVMKLYLDEAEINNKHLLIGVK